MEFEQVIHTKKRTKTMNARTENERNVELRALRRNSIYSAKEKKKQYWHEEKLKKNGTIRQSKRTQCNSFAFVVGCLFTFRLFVYISLMPEIT